MLRIRPTPQELHSKHIYNMEGKIHRRKQNVQLNKSLKRRSSV